MASGRTRAEQIRRGQNEDRLALLETLAEVSNRYPALRIGQLIINAIPPDILKRINGDIYYLTDKQLLEYLKEFDAGIQALREKG